jgi:hydrogenase expression/formation protein HypC
MCLAVPRRVLRIDGDRAEVDWDGEPLWAAAAGVPDLQPGEYVLVHAGQVLERISADEATEILALLEWIQSADSLYRPWINWAMVAVGIALLTSHAGQLVVGKFWTLIRGKGFNVCEIINDLLVTAFSGLALPVVLLIPTGRGAFISSPLAVLSAAAVGLIIGVFLYTHGMKQEMLAGQERIDRKRAGES